MHTLLSTPPTAEEISLLKHVDLEKMAFVFDSYFSNKTAVSFETAIFGYIKKKSLTDLLTLEFTNNFGVYLSSKKY